MEQIGRMPQKVLLNEDAVLTIHSHVPVTVTENLEQSTLHFVSGLSFCSVCLISVAVLIKI
jgi:hypothetical protein